MKTTLLVLATVIGSVLGVLFFLALDVAAHSSFGMGEWMEWTEFGGIISAGIGAIAGLALGRAACGRTNQARLPVRVAAELAPVVATPHLRKNCRPLTWMYRV